MREQKIGFVGAGNIARSLVGGLIAGGLDAAWISVSDPSEQQREGLSGDFGVQACTDNATVAAQSDVLFLAVKPQYMQSAATQIREAVATRRPLVISVAAGVRIDALSRWLGNYAAIVRTMPNRPALMRKGVTALFAAPIVSGEQRENAETLLASVGATVWVEREEQLDAVTAVSGSGPAYFFLLMELLEDAARELGLPDDVARTLAIETAYGAACMARERQDTPQVLRQQVTSPGGTTAAAVGVLEDANLRGIVSRAVAAACRRCAELTVESSGGER